MFPRYCYREFPLLISHNNLSRLDQKVNDLISSVVDLPNGMVQSYPIPSSHQHDEMNTGGPACSLELPHDQSPAYEYLMINGCQKHG